MTAETEPKIGRRPRRKTLRRKLILPVVVAVCIAVSLVAGASAWREGARDAAMQTSRLSATASVLASLSSTATAAGDRARAYEVLRAIGQMPGVVYARVERADGSLLTETGSGVRLVRDVSTRDGASKGLIPQLMSRTSEVSAPILHERRIVGEVVLLGRTEGVLGRFLGSLGVSLIAAIAAIAGGLAIAWPLQRGVTRPMEALTRSMADVQADHDYERTVEIAADDEVAELVGGFNRMLGEIRARDRRIAHHVAGLEQEVADRTADFRTAKEAAEAANSAKSDFLATMSHEIRTPMNGIMVMAEMLAGGEMPARQRRFAEVIAKSGSSLLAIINDILDFSKIEAGKLDLESVPTDVVDIAEDVASLFWEKACSKGLDLAVYVDPATPTLIAGDPTRLRQVIGNLVNNAIKFTETGGVLIEIEPESADTLRLSVRDTGVGIPKDKLGGVFGAFTQADQSTTRKFGGTGLGLAICKRLVDAMGGRFNVSSEVGRGSTFAFRIPASVVEPAAAWPGVSAAEAKVGLLHTGVATRRALGRYLARAGYVTAPAGEEAPLAVVFAAAGNIVAGQASAVPTICVDEYGDSAPTDMVRTGAAQAVLIQPFRRSELCALLQQLEAGQRLSQTELQNVSASDALPAFPQAHILVADDSAVNREVAMEALHRLSVRVTLVADGRAAIEKAAAERFDLILMDGSMPDIDGYDAARAIRAAEAGTRRTPIVALTAHVVGSAAEAWREADMDAVLHKPFTLQALAKTLAGFISPSAAPAQRPSTATVATAPPPPTLSTLLDPEVTEQLRTMAENGRSDFVDRVRTLYRDNAPSTAAQVADAAGRGDAEAVAKAAHALRSMSLNLGAREVVGIADRMETDARAGRLPDHRQCVALRTTLEATLAALTANAAPALAEGGLPPDQRALLDDLQKALRRDELHLVYQPQFDRDGQAILGVEALLRWPRPGQSPASPAMFIPLAEANGLIQPVTDWVLRRALEETRDLDGLRVAFNASATEFSDGGIVSRVKAMVADAQFDPRRLEMEITETAILQNEDQVRRNMVELQAYGVTMSLDDFGAGYSSLGHLRRYPFDKLKIDREFICDCATDVQSAAVVHAVVSIGRGLGMKVVAEGVETEAQRQFLKIAGVHAMQGFLFGRPMPIDALRTFRQEAAMAPARAAAHV
ncbi:MAG: EAL domain-containing protein [Caulobacteraceae bacterium]